MTHSNQQSNSFLCELKQCLNAGLCQYGPISICTMHSVVFKAWLEQSYLPREQVEAAIGPDECSNLEFFNERLARSELRQEIRSKLGLKEQQ